MTEREFEEILSRGHEINGVEFKGPGARTDKPFFARVVRAVLGMANRRDGGLVIVGVEDQTLEPVGLNDNDLATWSNYDVVSEGVNKHADPSINFDLDSSFEYHSNRVVIIRVREFEEIPILCCGEYPDPEKPNKQILRRGACYVRTRNKPATEEIPTQEEMRELLDLAIDKGVKRFVTRAQKAGLFPTMQPQPSSPGDEERFRKLIEDMQ